MPAGDAWSASEEATLGRLLKEGLTASQISKRLRGRSRNAVIGRAHRLGLVSTKPPKERRTRPSDATVAHRVRARSARAKVTATMKEPPEPIAPLNIPFNDREFSQCRAITDAARYAQKVCGHPVDERGIYCEAHQKLFYVRSPSKNR